MACRSDAPCKKGCYCLKGRQQFPAVLGGYYRNLRIWNDSHDDFKQQLFKILSKAKQTKFRWFDAGDCPSVDFLELIFETAKSFPKIKFLFYTKKYDMINSYLDSNTIPDNLCIRLSMWDNSWNVPNPHNLPTAYVDFKDSTRNPVIPKKAFKCVGGGKTTCSDCGVCFNKSVNSVVFKQH